MALLPFVVTLNYVHSLPKNEGGQVLLLVLLSMAVVLTVVLSILSIILDNYSLDIKVFSLLKEGARKKLFRFFLHPQKPEDGFFFVRL